MGEQVMDEMEVGDAVSLFASQARTLETKAADLQQHFDFVMQKTRLEHGSKRASCMHRPDADNTVTVIWYEVHWYGSKAAKTRRMTKKLIRKPKLKHGYNLDALQKLAQPWETDMVRRH